MAKKKPALSSIEVKNDVKHPNKGVAQQSIATHAILSFSYLMLLVGSTIITTLGLLQNQPAVVIGGMIIAPIMWPMVRVALGISASKKNHIVNGLSLLLISVVLTILTATVISLISPISVINSEILSRTEPTLLDLLIALTAGSIGALALIHPRVSPNLAGVAVAASLLPPLSVTGIGIALGNWEVSLGSFLLFSANTIALMFTALLTFTIAGLREKAKQSATRTGITATATLLVLIAIPLGIILRRQAFELQASNLIQSELTTQLAKISNQITVDELHVTLVENGQKVSVTARIWVPSGTSFDLAQKQQLTTALGERVQKPLELQLRLQPTIETSAITNSELDPLEAKISTELLSRIKADFKDTSIDTLSTQVSDDTVKVFVVVRANQDTLITQKDRERYESILSELTEKPVELNMEIIPRIQLVSEKIKQERQIEYVIREYFKQEFPEHSITNLSLASESSDESQQTATIVVALTIVSPQGTFLEEELLQELKRQLQKTFDTPTTLNVQTSTARVLSL